MKNAVVAWGVVLVLVAGALALLPLSGLLGYESSFALGVLAAFAGAQLGARAVTRARRGEPAPTPSGIVDDEWVEAHPTRAVARLYGRALGPSLAILAPPLAVLLLNALRVRNCAPLAGLGWYALLPLPSAAVGAAAGVVAGLLTRTKRGGVLLAAAVVVGSIAWGVARFYAAPPVFGYDPFAGYFPGSLYDEALAPSGTLALARALHLLGALAALSLAAALLDGRGLRLRTMGIRRCLGRRVGLVLAALLLCAGYLALRQATLPRLAPDARTIASALGARRTTPHLTLLYSPTGPWAKHIDLYATEAEFQYAELRRAFGGDPGRVTAFLFDSGAQKQRWTGARDTQIAKPWRHEIYLQFQGFPHPVMRHELAHVFAARFGDPVFHVARRRLGFNVGLIEGVAEAEGEMPGRLTLDEQVKAMRVLRVEPPLASVFGMGFLAQAPARAYTVAGSFVRWLVDQHGMAAFARVYRAGGGDGSWRAAYGQSFAELRAAWSAHIDATPLDADEAARLAERFRRPSIFHKTCAHTLAVRRQRAQQLSSQGRHAAALALLEEVCRDEVPAPSSGVAKGGADVAVDPALTLRILDEAMAAGDPERAERAAEQVLAAPQATDDQRARALLYQGDTALRAALEQPAATDHDPGQALDVPVAEARYRRALTLRLDPDATRQIRARLLALHNPRYGRALARYLVGDGGDRPGRDPALDLLRAQQIVDAAPESGLGPYLLGRQLVARERFGEALPLLDRALALGLPPGGFLLEARRLAARVAFRAGDYSAAHARFTALASDERAADPAMAREAHQWMSRCAFFAATTATAAETMAR